MEVHDRVSFMIVFEDRYKDFIESIDYEYRRDLDDHRYWLRLKQGFTKLDFTTSGVYPFINEMQRVFDDELTIWMRAYDEVKETSWLVDINGVY
jgi:hypothetical protein